MNLKKLLLLPIGLVVSAAGCAGIGPNATYYMGTTSFNYDTSYSPYMVKLNGMEIGGGGGGMNTSAVKLGPQLITWGESNSKKKASSKKSPYVNQRGLTRHEISSCTSISR